MSEIVGMGFDGGKHILREENWNPDKDQKVTPHALFVYCHCHLL